MEKYPVNDSHNTYGPEAPQSTDDAGSQANDDLDATADLSLAIDQQPTADLSASTEQSTAADQSKEVTNQSSTSPDADKEDTAELTIDDDQQDNLSSNMPYTRSSYLDNDQAKETNHKRRARRLTIGAAAIATIVIGSLTMTANTHQASAASVPEASENNKPSEDTANSLIDYYPESPNQSTVPNETSSQANTEDANDKDNEGLTKKELLYDLEGYYNYTSLSDAAGSHNLWGYFESWMHQHGYTGGVDDCKIKINNGEKELYISSTIYMDQYGGGKVSTLTSLDNSPQFTTSIRMYEYEASDVYTYTSNTIPTNKQAEELAIEHIVKK